MQRLTVTDERFPIRGGFTISRGSRSHAHVVTVLVEDGSAAGRGECTPYARYGETPQSVCAQITSIATAVEAGASRKDLQSLLSPGAARNAVDNALWDLEAKQKGIPVWQLAGLPEPSPLQTAFTLSLDTPDAMALAAWENRDRPLLKVKLGGNGDDDRMRAVCGHCGDARVIVDANEAWPLDQLWEWLDLAANLGIELVEQPLAAGEDELLAERPHAVPVCADESAHDLLSLERLKGLYEFVNIKLDKTGGLTEAFAMKNAAGEAGFGIFVGCMMGSSLAMAPAFLLAHDAHYVDLDAPLLLSEDRKPALAFDGSVVQPPSPALWG